MSNTLALNQLTQPVNLRVRTDIRDLIDKAAEETLLEQNLIRVSVASFEAIANIIDNPQPSEGINRLMNCGLK